MKMIFPAFNAIEAECTADLTLREKKSLTQMLRIILKGHRAAMFLLLKGESL